MAFLDETGLGYFWNKLKQKFLPLAGGTVTGNLAVKGSLTAAGAEVVTKDKLEVSNNLGTLVASYDGQSTVFFDFNLTSQTIIRIAFDNNNVRQLFTTNGGQSWQTIWSK